MIETSCLILVLVLFLILVAWKGRFRGEFYKTIPTPASVPFFGVALDIKSSKELLNVLMGYFAKYGRSVKGKIGPIRKIVITTDYRIIECILSSSKLISKSVEYNFLKPWLGEGLLTSDGNKWKKHRRALTSAFHFQILEQFVEVFDKCGDVLVEKLRNVTEKNTFDVYPFVTLCSLDIICESIMGISVNAQTNENSVYVQSVKNMCRILVERSTSPVQMYDFLYPLTKNYYTQKKSLKVLHKQTEDVIKARRKELENGAESHTNKKKMFLDILLQTEIDGRFLSDLEIRDEVDTFMFEGHDTTASALSFTMYSLAMNPEVQRKAFEEQQYIFEGRNEEVVTYADLQNMKYLENVIKESLRLYPSVPIIGRQSNDQAEFDNMKFPTDATMLVCVFATQRDSLYFKNPEKFDPDRFETLDGKQPFAYIPFSAGQRNCIGQKFAMLEIKSVVSKILRKFRLKPATPHHELYLVAETILKSANGIKIGIEQR